MTRMWPPSRAAGFSLVELMISMSLIMLLTLALITSFTFVARGDRSLQNYGEMNTQARRLLEQLGRDLRSATDVTDFTASELSLGEPKSTIEIASPVCILFPAS